MSGTSLKSIRRNERVLSDLEIYRAAEATIDQYGDGAGLHAAQRADEVTGGRPSVSAILVGLVREHQGELEEEAGRYMDLIDLL